MTPFPLAPVAAVANGPTARPLFEVSFQRSLKEVTGEREGSWQTADDGRVIAAGRTEVVLTCDEAPD